MIFLDRPTNWNKTFISFENEEIKPNTISETTIKAGVLFIIFLLLKQLLS